MKDSKTRRKENGSYIVLSDCTRVKVGAGDGTGSAVTTICGGTGTGKTETLKHTIASFEGSMIILDVKGRLYPEFGEQLEERGIKTVILNVEETEGSMRFNPIGDMVTSDDAAKISELVTDLSETEGSTRDSFWRNSMKLFFNANLGALAEGIKGFGKNPFGLIRLMSLYVIKDLAQAEKSRIYRLFSEHDKEYRAKTGKRSWAFEQFKKFLGLSEQTMSCIIVDAQSAFGSLDTPEMRRLTFASDFDLKSIGTERTAVFIRVSDIDRSKDLFINLFFNRLMCTLFEYADAQPDGQLPMPTLLILDDFCTAAKIHNFQGIVSNMRSRNIAVIMAIQAVSQLEDCYGTSWTAVLNNCDNLLYLGGNDPMTADYFARVFNVPIECILDMPVKHHYIKQRGSRSRLAETKKYIPEKGQ